MNAVPPAEEKINQNESIKGIAGGFASRLRLLVAALDRLDRLESGTGSWRLKFEEEELFPAAAELTLRGLRTAADSLNYIILKLLAENDSRSLDQMIERTGQGRLTLSERLNDLVQVGLATRLIDTDHAQITSAGVNLIQLIDSITTEVIEEFHKKK